MLFLCASYIGIGTNLAFTPWATLTFGGGKLWNLGWFNFPFHDYMIGAMGHVVLLITGYGASLVFPNRNPEARELTLAGWRRRMAATAEIRIVPQAIQ